MPRAFAILLVAAMLVSAAAPLLHAHLPDPDEIVFFNTRSLKYHCPTCSAAKRCTKNCISISLKEAKERGGVPCKLCGGTCR